MFLYILYNSLIDRYYIGVTNDRDRRLREHNRWNSDFTGSKSGTWNEIFIRKYPDIKLARNEERRLKRAKNRKYLEWYIQQYNRMVLP